MEERSFKQTVGEIFSGFSRLIQSEIQLAKAEARQNALELRRHSRQSAMYFGIAALGVLALLAFAVIGLGIVLGDMYWLSALIIGVVLATGGGTAAIFSRKKLQQDPGTHFPVLTQSLEDDAAFVQGKVRSLTSHIRVDRTTRQPREKTS